MYNLFKRRYQLIFLLIILIFTIFFRSYNIIERMDFGHDADLYSWIVKDIVVNHHLRLIGQLTSAPGIFIGPLFYYALIPFFLLTKMDPVGVAAIPALIGIFTVLSYYFVFSKLFRAEVGLIGAFLYAVLIATVNFDRWIVPTISTPLWSIWYLYSLICIVRGNFSVLPLLALLMGLIWHVHIALIPTLFALPVAFFLSHKLPNIKQICTFILILFITSLPLMLFEVRHNFSQTISLIKNFTGNFGTGNQISEQRKIFLQEKNDNGKLNLDQNYKFSLDIDPQTPKSGDMINIKVTTKNPKYSTLIIYMDCGDPQKFEIGNITAEFKWSSINCNPGTHQITATARTSGDSFFKKTTDKLTVVLEKEKTNINSLLLSTFNTPSYLQYIFPILLSFLPLILWKFKLLKIGDLAIIYSWILGIIAFFTMSSIAISEYYLASINTLIIFIISTLFWRLYQLKTVGKYSVILIFSLLLMKNFTSFISNDNYKIGYLEKKQLTEFIAKDSKLKNLSCVGINYISSLGSGVGFRYLFYLNNIHVIHSVTNVPVYNIVIPEELSSEPTKQKFGHIGVIPPAQTFSKESLDKSCQTPDTNLTDSMFGYVE